MKGGIYLGIDPGKGGAITIITSYEIWIEKMPDTEANISDFLKSWSRFNAVEDAKAIIESQHAFPGMGAGAQWTFAQHYGFLRGCLVTLGISLTETSPQKWMAYFGLKKSQTERKAEYKKRILQKAQNLFPDSLVALQTADSLMLAEYLKQTSK